MALGIIDILTIVIVFILIIAIVIINLTNLINKKLTSISVNIPPIEIPDPNITVKIQRKCGYTEIENNNDEYKIFVEKNGTTNYTISPKIEDTLQSIEKFAPIDSEQKTIQELTNVPSGSFLNPTGELCNSVQEEVKNRNNVLQNVLNEQYNISIPEQEKTTITPEIKNILNNRKINKKFLNDAYKYMIQNDLYTKDQYVQSTKKIQQDGKKMDEYDFDPNEWYKQFQVKVPTYLEDTKTRGYNLEQYDNIGDIYSVGKINLTNNLYKNPKPNGFIFNNYSVNIK